MNAAGRNAWTRVSIDGFGLRVSNKARRTSFTIASSGSLSNPRRRSRAPRSRPGCPAGSIEAMSKPDAFTKMAATSSPVTVRHGAFTDALPPPCSTSAGSHPSRRLEYVRSATASPHDGPYVSTARAAS